MTDATTPVLTRQNAMTAPRAGKEPRHHYVEEEEDEDEDEDTDQDLAAFFDAHGVSMEDRVKICRAYANYLTSFLPKKAKRVKKE